MAAFTEKETAERIGMSTQWLRSGRCTGNPECPPHVKIGKAVRYLDIDLDRWIAERRVDPRKVFDAEAA
jgi:predicted DNA-binding transcriptional regulator AlpA